MEYLTPFQNRTKMTFSTFPWNGKEYLQASFNITAQLNVKLFSTHSAALGRSTFALAGLPQRHCSVLISSLPANVKCSYWYAFRATPSAEGAALLITSVSKPLLFSPWSSSAHENYKLSFIAEMNAETLPASCSPYSIKFLSDMTVFWWCSDHNWFYKNLYKYY